MRILKSPDAPAILFLAVFPWLVFWQAATGMLVFAAGDLSSFFYPVRLQLAWALAEGRLPLWEPAMGAGFPLFAEGQVAALYPPNLILYRLLPAPMALSWSILLHLSWAALGMYAFARASGLRITSATLAGFVFSFGGFFLAHLQHVSLISTGAWLGWILFLQNRMLTARRAGMASWRGWLALAGLAIGLQLLSGFPQIALFNLIAFVAVGLYETLARRTQVRIRENLLLLASSLILGLLMGAVQLLPTAELAALSTRGAVGERFFTSYSLEFTDLPQFFSPFTTLGEPLNETQEFWGFLGVGVLVLALSALTFRRDARTFFFGAFALLALALALGGNNPVYSVLYAMPIFNRFRVPARFLFLFSLAIVYLAAIGFDELQNRARDSARAARLAPRVAIPIGLAVAAVFSARTAMGQQFWYRAWEYLPWVFLAAAVALIGFTLKGILARQIFAVAFFGVVVIELSLFSLPFMFGLDILVPSSFFTATPLAIQAMDASQPLARVWTNSYAPDIRPNRPMAYGKPSAQIYSPLALARQVEYVNSLSPAMLNLMGIRYVIEPAEVPPDTAVVPTSTLPLDIMREKISIPLTRVAQVDLVSFTNGTTNLADDTIVGQLALSSPDGAVTNIPIKLGTETAEWNFDLVRDAARHNKPANAQSFMVNLPGQGNFQAEKFVARYELTPPILVNQISASSALRSGGLSIDRIILRDESGQSSSAWTLARVNDYALAQADSFGVMYENKGGLPRAFLVHRAERVDDGQVIGKMSEPGFQPDRVVYLAAGEPLNRAGESDAPRLGDQVNVIEYLPERVMIRVKSDEPGYLILADSWYPGWVAHVDGAPAEIERADFMFRAVKMSAGEHTVVFEYQPTSFAWGAGLSALACLAATGIVWAGRVR